MKHAPIHNRLLALVAMLALALIFSAPLTAQESEPATDDMEQEEVMAGELLDAIHQFRLKNFIALNDYYNYTMDPDESLISGIDSSLASSQEQLERIGNLAGDSLTGSEIEDLEQAYADFEQQMEINIEDMREAGYPDLRLLSDMANQAQALSALSEEIYDAVAEQEVTPTVSDVELARRASVTMALMVTRYSARSSSTVAQVFQGADSDVSLDQLARDFEETMEELRSRTTDAELDELLSEVNTKWEFIRNSYINYDERNVSFVINRYSTSIVDNMEQVVERLKAT